MSYCSIYSYPKGVKTSSARPKRPNRMETNGELQAKSPVPQCFSCREGSGTSRNKGRATHLSEHREMPRKPVLDCFLAESSRELARHWRAVGTSGRSWPVGSVQDNLAPEASANGRRKEDWQDLEPEEHSFLALDRGSRAASGR